MIRFLLDTGPAQQFINNRNGVRDRAELERRRGNRVGICMPVLGELWSGVECSQSRELNLRKLRHGVSQLVNWPFDESSALEYGRIFALLRRLGRPMQQIDIQIAAIAMSLGNCVVVTTDSDMLAIPGLPTEKWSNQSDS
ncbi:MAG: type II toxin-antitoxin system VapC family toxin [Planctomycetaceae bacterium]